MKKIILATTLILSTTTFANTTCKDVERYKEFGTSELNGLTLESKNNGDRNTFNTIDFSFGSNKYVRLAGRKTFLMYNYMEDENVISFESEISKDRTGKFKNPLNAFKFVFTRLSEGIYDVEVFEHRYEGSFTKRTVVWDTMTSNFVQGDDTTTPLRFEATDDSIEARNNFKCI
ncbi:hypothetical protein ACOLNO_002943 [Vibrio parahaemolyticus]